MSISNQTNSTRPSSPPTTPASSTGQARAQQATERARRRARYSQRYRAINALFVFHWPDFFAFLHFTGKWILLAGVAGTMAGVASWIFLTSLAWATATRVANPALLYALPVAGFLTGWLYHRFGGTASLGNNLVIDEVNSNRSTIPTRMAPLVLLGTVVTHLFGGSAGREGTAIQMGASLADRLRRLLGLTGEERRLLLMAGISGGFGSVFGVPVAGFVFGMEVQGIGRIRYDGIIPCLVASFVGDLVARALGTPHAHYPLLATTPLAPLLLLKVIVAGIAFGLTSIAFVELTHGIKYLVGRITAWPPLYPVIGGVAVLLLTWLVGTRDYLGLSLPLIAAGVEGGEIAGGAFALKLIFTSVTLGTGYYGGEVTPLFAIGATLGNTLGTLLAVDPGLLASIGLVAVFAGASNTPLACALMGVELFGSGGAPYFFLGCVVAYLASGHRGIYMTQRIYQTKSVLDGIDLNDVDPDENLRTLRARRGGGWLPDLPAVTAPLEQKPVTALMTPSVISVHERATLRDVIVKALQAGVRALPVVNDEQQVVGIVTEHDLLCSPLKTSYHQLQLLDAAARTALLATAATIPVVQVCSAPAITLASTMTVADALRLLRAMGIKRLPIVDKGQRLVGMLTRSDILRNLLYSAPSLLHTSNWEEQRVLVREVALEPALTVAPALALPSLLHHMRDALTLHAVVIDEAGIAIGMISESDLLTQTTVQQRAAITAFLYAEAPQGNAPQPKEDEPMTTLADLTVADLMTTPLITVGPADDVYMAIQLLIEHQIKRLPVIDENGRLLGLVDRRTLLYAQLP